MTRQQKRALAMLYSRVSRIKNAAEMVSIEATRRAGFVQGIADEIADLTKEIEATIAEVQTEPRKVFIISDNAERRIRELVEMEMTDIYIAKQVDLPVSVVRYIIKKGCQV